MSGMRIIVRDCDTCGDEFQFQANAGGSFPNECLPCREPKVPSLINIAAILRELLLVRPA